MSDVSAEIRIFPDKEMLSVDMAEVLDAAMFKSGVIQGCGIHLSGGTLTMDSGRIIIKGRLGVVSAGAIPVPTLSTTSTCTLVAVCDLQSGENPFYIALLSPDSYANLQASADSGGTFNVSNGIAYVVLGTASVNPSTGNVTSWKAADGASAKKGEDAYNDLKTQVDNAVKTVNNMSGIVGKSMFKTQERIYYDIHFNANSEHTGEAIDITESGYRAVALVGWGCFKAAYVGAKNDTWCVISRCYLWRSGDKDYLDYYAWNQHPTEDAIATIQFRILYVKDSVITK